MGVIDTATSAVGALIGTVASGASRGPSLCASEVESVRAVESEECDEYRRLAPRDVQLQRQGVVIGRGGPEYLRSKMACCDAPESRAAILAGEPPYCCLIGTGASAGRCPSGFRGYNNDEGVCHLNPDATRALRARLRPSLESLEPQLFLAAAPGEGGAPPPVDPTLQLLLIGCVGLVLLAAFSYFLLRGRREARETARLARLVEKLDAI